MADDDVRRKILVRRATFLAAALTGLSAGGGCDRDGGMGQPCLSIARPPPDGAVEPEVCLKVAPTQDASGPEPRMCLKVAPDLEEEPAPCLSVARPPPKGS